jgi:hypothetical protein
MRAVTGYINVARSIFDHPMFDDGKPYSPREAWLWLISNAAWRPMQIRVRNGRTAEILNLERGQLSYSRSFLRKAWNWPSEKRVRTFLSRLEREHMIDLQTGQLQTVISIRNYGLFQNSGELSGPSNGPAMGQQKARNGPEEENIISIKTKNMLPPPSPAGFDDWYSIYPRKKQSQAAKKAFAKLIASEVITLDALMAKTRTFAANWASEPKERRRFIPYPASWLNAGGYHDEPEGDEGEPAPVVRDPRSFSDDDWQKRVIHFQNGQEWLEPWGPKPGAPGCLVPARLLLNCAPDRNTGKVAS